MRNFYSDLGTSYRAAGVKAMMSGTNWFQWPWEIASQVGGDFTDSHHYYGGDQIGPGYGLGGLWTAHPPDAPGGPFARIGAMALPNTPVISSECGNNPPKTFRGAYPIGLAAVSSLQGWDALVGFAFSQSSQAQDALSDYEWESDPITVANWAAGALIYRRGDVKEAKQSALMLLPKDEQYALHWEDNGAKQFQNTVGFNIAIETHKVTVALADKVPVDLHPDFVMTPATAAAARLTQTLIRSDTGELQRDWSTGIGTIDTPRTQAAYGYLGSAKTPVKTASAAFGIETPFATIVLSSLSDVPILQSPRLLLVATARAENTAQASNLSNTKLVDPGHAPVLCEPVVGKVLFRTDRLHVELIPINADGTRQKPIECVVSNGVAILDLKASYQTLYYEIEVR
jgi:hypothetical protein